MGEKKLSFVGATYWKRKEAKTEEDTREDLGTGKEEGKCVAARVEGESRIKTEQKKRRKKEKGKLREEF